MLRRVTFITAAFTLTLLAAGCVKTYDPSPEQGGSIRFGVGSLLLEDDALSTRASATLRTDFAGGDSFRVYARRNNAASSPVFNGETVSTSDGTTWDYATASFLRYWGWNSNADYYDFIGVYTQGSTPVQTGATDLTVTSRYNVQESPFDLMMAVKRVSGTDPDRSAPVMMDFHHMLSAVKVNVVNVSKNASSTFTLNGYHFENLILEANAKAVANSLTTFSWVDYTYAAAGVSLGGETLSSAVTLQGQGGNPTQRDGDTELFIPQRLNVEVGGRKPCLVLDYTVGDTRIPDYTIPLEEIKREEESTITDWSMGVRYTYTVRIRIGGGVQVTLVTTPWDHADAETPGILIF